MAQRNIGFILLALMLLNSVCATSHAHASCGATLVVVADEWCPHNCQPDTEEPGYAIELLVKVFAEHGIKVKYVVMPWKRALESVRIGIVDAATGAMPDEAPDLWLAEMEHGWNDVGFFTKSPQWKYTGKKSLKGMMFGVAAGYSYGRTIDDMIKSGEIKTEAVSSTAPLESNMRKLKYGRLDGVIAEKSVFEYTAKRIKMSETFYYGGGASPGDPLYVVFSPERETSKEYMRIWLEGLKSLRATGEFADILSKYGVTDWR